jgi:hypothetical protein
LQQFTGNSAMGCRFFVLERRVILSNEKCGPAGDRDPSTGPETDDTTSVIFADYNI